MTETRQEAEEREARYEDSMLQVDKTIGWPAYLGRLAACKTCNGDGWVRCDCTGGEVWDGSELLTCSVCNGSGERPCPECQKGEVNDAV